MSDDGFSVLCSWFMVAFLVWACTEPRLYPESVKYADKVCAENDGWKFIEEGVSEFSSVTCKNGAEFNYNWNDLKVDKK